MIGANWSSRARRGAGQDLHGRKHGRINAVAAIVCATLLCAGAFGAATTPVAAASSRSNAYGPYGPEGPRLREQLWMLPSGDPEFPLRATVFRPDDDAGSENRPVRRPMVVINHGTSDATRLSVAMPVYYWLSRWFVDRGYIVMLPQRRGHGATGGPLAEAIGNCADPDHYLSGLAAARDIEAATDYISREPFVAPGETVVVGISSGGWASLALASRNPGNVRAVVNIAGGRGGRPSGESRVRPVCGERRLIEAARAYGTTARLPTLWLYAANDSLFRPELAKGLAEAWAGGGGAAELHIFSPYGSDGHTLADDRAGWDVWGPALDRFLAAARKGPDGPPQPAVAAPGVQQQQVVQQQAGPGSLATASVEEVPDR